MKITDSSFIHYDQLHAIMYVPKMTKAAIQAAAIIASAQSFMISSILSQLNLFHHQQFLLEKC